MNAPQDVVVGATLRSGVGKTGDSKGARLLSQTPEGSAARDRLARDAVEIVVDIERRLTGERIRDAVADAKVVLVLERRDSWRIVDRDLNAWRG